MVGDAGRAAAPGGIRAARRGKAYAWKGRVDLMTRRAATQRNQLKTWLATVALLGLVAVAAPVLEAQRPTLYWGSTGQQVRVLQWRLQEWGYYRGTIDGVFGNSTSQAVKNFQARNGLPVDGIVGPATWSALGLGWRAQAQPTATRVAAGGRSDDLTLLARLIEAEGQGEPYEGMVSIAAVVLNRVESPKFPNSVSGVIFQPHAFESVTNGLIWRRSPSALAWQAARDALNGWDPTYGSLFFWNPSKPVSGWIWSRPVVRQVGAHVFAL